MKKVEAEKAEAGDIVMIAGLPTIYIGETICGDENSEPLPAIAIDEPPFRLILWSMIRRSRDKTADS